jgi:transcriptional regulator with XRE-family HTH domain
MPARRDPGTKAETRLAQVRLRRGVSQEELAAATGLSLSAYVRLERGRVRNPSLAKLANCALALGVPIQHVIDPAWTGWTTFPGGPTAPPDRLALWRRAPRERS